MKPKFSAPFDATLDIYFVPRLDEWPCPLNIESSRFWFLCFCCCCCCCCWQRCRRLGIERRMFVAHSIRSLSITFQSIAAVNCVGVRSSYIVWVQRNIFAGTVWGNEKFTIPNLLTMSIGECKSCFSFSRSQRHTLPPPHPHTHTHPYPLSVFYNHLNAEEKTARSLILAQTKFIIVSQWSFTIYSQVYIWRSHWLHELSGTSFTNYKWYETRTSARRIDLHWNIISSK